MNYQSSLKKLFTNENIIALQMDFLKEKIQSYGYYY